MFDTYQLGRDRTTYVPYAKEVHEHRAPTDESVRLLKEMETAAAKSRVDAFHLDPNVFHGFVEVMEMPSDQSMRAVLTFDLNGRRHKVDEAITHYHGDPQARFTLLTMLRDKAATLIASEILASSVRELR